MHWCGYSIDATVSSQFHPLSICLRHLTRTGYIMHENAARGLWRKQKPGSGHTWNYKWPMFPSSRSVIKDIIDYIETSICIQLQLSTCPTTTKECRTPKRIVHAARKYLYHTHSLLCLALLLKLYFLEKRGGRGEYNSEYCISDLLLCSSRTYVMQYA